MVIEIQSFTLVDGAAVFHIDGSSPIFVENTWTIFQLQVFGRTIKAFTANGIVVIIQHLPRSEPMSSLKHDLFETKLVYRQIHL